MSQDTQKNYPAATEDISKMFKFGEPKTGILGHGAETPDLGHVSPDADLPVLDSASAHTFEASIAEDVQAAKKTNFGPLVKLVLPYMALFIVGVLAYYFFFSKFSFPSLSSRSQKAVVQSTKETALSQLEKQNMEGYTAWIKGYYFDVSDAEVLDPEGDNSGNGLTNFQKYMLKLNPKAYDTLGLGVSDTESLGQGVNPLTGGKLTEDQKKILDNYIDMEVAMNRLALANVQGRAHVAGATVWSGLRGANQNSYFQSGSGNSLRSQNIGPAAQNNNSSFNLPPINNQNTVQNSTQPVRTYQRTSPATGASASPDPQSTLGLNDLDVDTSVPGRLEIPDLNINVPIIWTSNTKDFNNDLKSGVVHYPGTALPGQIGTSYISGHSSNYVWAKGNYNQIFATLGGLPDNASFKITVVQKNGKDARLHYVVTSRKEYKATDQEQFANTGKPVVALSTCWPVGSTAKRLVVFGEMTQMEKD